MEKTTDKAAAKLTLDAQRCTVSLEYEDPGKCGGTAGYDDPSDLQLLIGSMVESAIYRGVRIFRVERTEE